MQTSHRDNLWQEWLIWQALIKEARKTAICDKLTLEALSLARLGQKDEVVFSHLVYLMGTYREVVEIFEKNTDDPVPDQVAGLCDVLNSRLKQFEDVAPSQGNPIAKEKQEIIEKTLLGIAAKIETLEINESLKIIYQESLTQALSAINDLHTRKLTSYYTDLLEREWEVLGLIISIQVKGIEALWGMEYTNAPLSKLREAYQQTGPIISGFRKLIQTAPQVVPPDQDFHIISNEPDNHAFLAALEPEIEMQFEKRRIEYLESTKSLEQKIEDELTISEEIISTFGATDFWLTNTPKPKVPPENEILTGITEAIKIKIESLKESMEQFKETAKIGSELPVPSEDTQAQLFSAWILNPPSQEDLDAFFESAAPIIAYAEKLAKEFANTDAKLDKYILRYQKESLLYEISTYEEILYYSVSRIRESELPQVQAAVEILDETFVALESILEEKGITVIRPNPHEPFIAREHEVLTAEQQDDFAKGEIIKTMTSGYKLGDQVILRANVVAAR